MPVPFDLENQIHLCETLSGHQGVIRAMAEVQNRVCVGGTDGKVRVSGDCPRDYSMSGMYMLPLV